jgi:hypothetical protein
MVVGGADDHGLDVLLVEHAAPVPVGFGLGEDLQGLFDALVVNVAERDHVFANQGVVVGRAAAPHAHQRHVQLVTGGVLTAERSAPEDGQSSGRRGDRLQ